MSDEFDDRIGWNFPSNGGGKIDAFNDAGIETFASHPMMNLAREAIQNGLDARNPFIQEPVKMAFKFIKIKPSTFPGVDEFRSSLDECKSFWQSAGKGSKKLNAFIEKATCLLSMEEIPVLIISDFNTTGLRGSDRDIGTNWSSLIKSVGESDKDSGAGGSFGIGKHAPFACSQLRTVYYLTKDIDGKTAFQGKAILVSHKNGKTTTQGTGYWGRVNESRPLTDVRHFPELARICKRDAVGSDVLVMGFNGDENWSRPIIETVLDNFLVAILDGSLVVDVNGLMIESSTLPQLIDQYCRGVEEMQDTVAFYGVLNGGKPPLTTNIGEGGLVELYLTKTEESIKEVAMFRKNGMKIFNKKGFRTPIQLAGVCIVKGERLNEFLRSLEPPGHDDWSAERSDDPQVAKTTLKKLYSWINDQVRALANEDLTARVDFYGMNRFLPDSLDNDADSLQSESQEYEPGSKRTVSIKQKDRKPRLSIQPTDEPSPPENGNGGDGAILTPGKPNEGTGGMPTSKPSGGGAGGSRAPGTPGNNKLGPVTISLKKVRIACEDPATGKYIVTVTPEVSSSEAFLSISAVGESGQENVHIKSAKITGSNMALGVDGNGKVGALSLSAGTPVKIELSLPYGERCALEVVAHGN